MNIWSKQLHLYLRSCMFNLGELTLDGHRIHILKLEWSTSSWASLCRVKFSLTCLYIFRFIGTRLDIIILKFTAQQSVKTIPSPETKKNLQIIQYHQILFLTLSGHWWSLTFFNFVYLIHMIGMMFIKIFKIIFKNIIVDLILQPQE